MKDSHRRMGFAVQAMPVLPLLPFASYEPVPPDRISREGAEARRSFILYSLNFASSRLRVRKENEGQALRNALRCPKQCQSSDHYSTGSRGPLTKSAVPR